MMTNYKLIVPQVTAIHLECRYGVAPVSLIWRGKNFELVIKVLIIYIEIHIVSINYLSPYCMFGVDRCLESSSSKHTTANSYIIEAFV